MLVAPWAQDWYNFPDAHNENARPGSSTRIAVFPPVFREASENRRTHLRSQLMKEELGLCASPGPARLAMGPHKAEDGSLLCFLLRAATPQPGLPASLPRPPPPLSFRPCLTLRRFEELIKLLQDPGHSPTSRTLQQPASQHIAAQTLGICKVVTVCPSIC